jgi:hypothetical protein
LSDQGRRRVAAGSSSVRADINDGVLAYRVRRRLENWLSSNPGALRLRLSASSGKSCGCLHSGALLSLCERCSSPLSWRLQYLR